VNCFDASGAIRAARTNGAAHHWAAYHRHVFGLCDRRLQ
jgi:hypothetical protein